MVGRQLRIHAARVEEDSRRQEILSAQIRLLYANANTGVGVTILAATTLAILQWGIVSNFQVLGWWLYMILISVSRGTLARRYRLASPGYTEISGWRAAFTIGAGLAGTGWGGAGILLYPEAHLPNQVFLFFVLGGMMLGAASLLAPRPEAFLAFLIPTGLVPTARLLVQGDQMHYAMGLLAAVFTLATLITTGRIYRTVDSSLTLQFENRDLVEDLQAAKSQTEAVNQALELRVQERTVELRESEERFRSLSNASLEGIMIHDQGVILDANLAFARLFGYKQPEELIGKNGLECLLSPESLASIHERLQQRKEKGPLEVTGIRKDGTVFVAETDSRLVKYLGHDASIVSWRDITERKLAQEERQRSMEQLRALAARLQSVREEERKRVAREIHDQLGQVLTAIKIDLSGVVRELPANQGDRTSSILKLVDETIQSVRRISTELRPGILDDLGLVDAVEWAGEDFEARTGTKCRLNLPEDDISIDPEQATAVFRIFQETLTNVARHADASEIEVRLAKDDRDLTLEVHDNGGGIPEDKLSNGESLGILGMRERALLLGGELTISGAPGEGTTVRLRIPEAHRT
ncbi:MAG TPA: PAS domain S-box protein [Terriglobia bacterium]|nr:PAS domain S-box protein [Terriglobia bacterium]